MLNRTSDITQSTPEWQGVRKSREVNYSEGSREAEEERSPKALPEIKRSKCIPLCSNSQKLSATRRTRRIQIEITNGTAVDKDGAKEMR
ncbi:hypothetical protein ANTRET_LOCUS10961 [Anthophora retusa]